MNHDSFDDDDDLDWHGAKAKRKRSLSTRRTGFITFGFGFLMALTMMLCGVVVYFVNRVGTYAAAKPPQLIEIITATAPPTAIPTALPSVTALPTALPVNTRTVAKSRIIEYSGAYATSVQLNLTFFHELAALPKPGYSFRSLRIGHDQQLYVAHTRSLGPAPCDKDEAYWIIGADGTQSASIADPSMVSPTQIAFDSFENRYVLARDCKQGVPALFWFNAENQLMSIFPLAAVGDDVAITPDNRIFVTLSGFAAGDENGKQNHLLELRADQKTNIISEVERYGYTDAIRRYRSLTVTPLLEMFILQTQPDEWDSLLTFSLNDPSQPQQKGTLFMLEPGSVTNLLFYEGALFGLDIANGTLIQFADKNGNNRSSPIPHVRPQSFTVNPANGHWFVAGDDVPAN